MATNLHPCPSCGDAVVVLTLPHHSQIHCVACHFVLTMPTEQDLRTCWNLLKPRACVTH